MNNYIPFGLGCYVAQGLKCVGLRNKSYAYDWCILDSSKIKQMLDDLKSISTDDILYKIFTEIERCKWTELEQYTYDACGAAWHSKIYNIIFPHHDLSSSNVKEIMKRRIDRMKNDIYDSIIVIGNKFYDYNYKINGITYNDTFQSDICAIKESYNTIIIDCYGDGDIAYTPNYYWMKVSNQFKKIDFIKELNV